MRGVLIVDGDRAIHPVIRGLTDWAELGLAVPRSAFDGAEALTLMQRWRPAVVLADRGMPGMDGADFLETAAARFPEAQFILVSDDADFEYARAGLRCGAADYLLKPVDAAELDRALQRALSRLPAGAGEGSAPDDIAAELRRYIDQNYARGISLDALAERFHFSREYLGRVFRARYDTGVYEYVQRVRMERAVALLKESGLSVADVAERLGYSNANYFSKAFRRHFGRSPSSFRAGK